MYRELRDKDRKDKNPGHEKSQARKREDLEDGEIDADEDKRRRERKEVRREPSEDIRRGEYRRDDRHRALYENGDRLSFRRDRDRDLPSRDRDRGLVDRGRPSWSPSTAQHRHSPY